MSCRFYFKDRLTEPFAMADAYPLWTWARDLYADQVCAEAELQMARDALKQAVQDYRRAAQVLRRATRDAEAVRSYAVQHEGEGEGKGKGKGKDKGKGNAVEENPNKRAKR